MPFALLLLWLPMITLMVMMVMMVKGSPRWRCPFVNQGPGPERSHGRQLGPGSHQPLLLYRHRPRLPQGRSRHLLLPGAQEEFEDIGGNAVDGVTAVTSAPGVVDIFTRGFDNTVSQRRYDNGVWGAWNNIGGNVEARPDGVAWGRNKITLTAQGNGSTIASHTFDGASWSGWQMLTGLLGHNPPISPRGGADASVYAIGTDNAISSYK